MAQDTKECERWNPGTVDPCGAASGRPLENIRRCEALGTHLYILGRVPIIGMSAEHERMSADAQSSYADSGMDDFLSFPVERTALLLVLLDVSGFSEHPPLEEYRMLLAELEQFSADLIRKPRLVALTKIDTLGSRDPLLPIREELTRCGEQVFSISSVTSEGLNELLNALASGVVKIRSGESEATRSAEIQAL